MKNKKSVSESPVQEETSKKQVGYKFVSYPICIIFAVAMFFLEFFVIIPVITHYCVVIFSADMEILLSYYPSFICLDILTVVGVVWLTFTLINGITGICKKHIKSKK